MTLRIGWSTSQCSDRKSPARVRADDFRGSAFQMRVRAIVKLSCLACLVCFGLAACTSATAPWNLSNYRSFRQPGMAMEPAMGPGDIVYVDTSYFQTNPPKVGDVVLYNAKSIKNGPTSKRIVALGGDTIQIKDGKLVVNGLVVGEPYLKPGGATTPYSRSWGPAKLSAGCIFLLGDYRDHSQDSRVDGCSTAADLVGLVEYVSSAAWPNEIHKIK